MKIDPLEIRRRLGLTQAAMAEKLGLRDRGHLSRVENGRQELNGPLLRLYERINDDLTVGDAGALNERLDPIDDDASTDQSTQP